MNLNRPLIQTEDCSPTWLETNVMQADGRRVLQQMLAYIRFRRRTNRKKSRLRSGQRTVSATFVFIGALGSTSEEPGFHTEVCAFTDDVILFFFYLKDGITRCIFKSKTTKLKHQNFIIVCVLFPASEGRVMNMTHNLKWRHVWNPLLKQSERKLQLSRLLWREIKSCWSR